ncbi:MAG: DUF4830 domain-containing protein [Clostridia bacterium]|nr:DUF4830 domain-containing protein [Clostridia bacterium]
MFIYSFKAGTVRFFGVLCVTLLALITLIAFVPSYDSSVPTGAVQSDTVSYDKIKTNEDRINFLKQFGWQTEEEPVEIKEITIPTQFDKVLGAYNELQRSQGLDLAKYKNKTVTRYTYIVTNYPDYDGVVYANILVYRKRVIGGDICSADRSGFVTGFDGK